MSYNLFLDDRREPMECASYMHMRIGQSNLLYISEDWRIAKSYEEFVAVIEIYGLPTRISFDHDLADEHYHGSEIVLSSVLYRSYKEKTGYEAVKWLVAYHLDNGGEFPACYVHTMNPSGYENIQNYLTSYHLKVLRKNSEGT